MASNKLIKSLKGNKLFNLRTVSDGTINDTKVYLDSGSYVLNLVLSGDMFRGYIGNKLTALYSDSGVGKTFLCLAAARELLKKDKNAAVIYLDTESATDEEQIKNIVGEEYCSRVEHQGVRFIEDLSRLLLTIAEEQKAIPEKQREQILIIIDSIGNLSTSKEVTDLTEGNDKVDMTKAKKLTAMFRAVTIPLAEAGIGVLFTNHAYDTQDLYSQKIMKGGKSVVYLASTILELSKKKDKDGTEVVGNIVRATAKKSRKSKENAIVSTYISYKTGLNKYFGLLELAESAGLVKRVGNKYEFPDGQKLWLKDVLRNPEKCWTQSLLEDINVAVKHMFNYGSSIADDLELDEDESN